MSHRHDDADPVEHDPTGMRALLGSLPDPGPMPDHLVARITAALEEESRTPGTDDLRAAAAAGWAPPPAPGEMATAGLTGSDDGTVVPLRRRRTWLLGAAAAAVVVLGVGGLVVDRLAPGGIEASLGLTQGADDAGSSASAADADASDGAGGADQEAEGGGAERALAAEPLTADRAVRVRVVAVDAMSGDEVARAVDTVPVPTYSAFAEAGVAISKESSGTPVATPQGARDCADALGISARDGVLVVLTRVDDSPVAVVVAPAAGENRQAWVVGRGCSADDPELVDGPLAVG